MERLEEAALLNNSMKNPSLLLGGGGNLRRTRKCEYERKAKEATPTVKRNYLIAIWCVVNLRLGKEIKTVYTIKSGHC
jgi:hypothetical protein